MYLLTKTLVNPGDDNCEKVVVDRYHVTWEGRSPRPADPFVDLWPDGSIVLHSNGNRIFEYNDTWKGIVLAINTALIDKISRDKNNKREWLDGNGDKTCHFGIKVDLSINDAIRAIKSSKLRTKKVSAWNCSYNKLQIMFNGKWLNVARTDLFDDVCTGLCETKKLAEWKNHYISRVMYGARIKENTFAVIDSVTDG